MKHLVFPAIALLLLAQPLPAEEAEHGQAGYEDMPEFGGPESVTEQLKRADELREAPYDWPFFDGGRRRLRRVLRPALLWPLPESQQQSARP
jgi:hypothetical protein